ncbi:MAG: serine/threonine protein kinase [Planctomycetes bacterium]|nr:serine/threonine protein kinase [Planctomycetota bacterium]
MSQDGDSSLAALVEDYVQRRRAGEALDLLQFAQRAGARSAELASLLASVDMLERARHGGPVRAGDRLGDFVVRRELGRGGMGIVFEAEHLTLQRLVALKVLDAATLGDSSRITRFHREARAAARLHHTNIVPIHGTDSAGDLHFYAMQLIDGCSLDRVIAVRRDGALTQPPEDHRSHPVNIAKRLDADPIGSAVRIAVQLADALDYAHRLGVLHRDVKPANVLLDGDGTAWIADFGVARLLDEHDLTRSGNFVGTLRYMAPEQLRGRGDQRADVFALGLVLHELLTLAPPYGEGDSTDLLPRVEAAAIEPPSARNHAVPRDLETVVLKALAPDPAHRYQSAGAFAADLRAVLEDRPVSARRASAVERCWRWARRNRLVTALALLAGTGAVAAAALGVTGSLNTRSALVLAEDNLELALSAFEEVFASLTGGAAAPGPTLDDRIFEVSSKDAAALQQLATFYDRFAARNEHDARLAARTVMAHERVGVIHLHLGDHEAAEAALRRALALVAKADRAANARLRVELGRCRMAARDFDGARRELDLALAVADGGDFDVLRQHARAHDLLALCAGGRGWYESPLSAERPKELATGWAERAREHHGAAERILADLLRQRPDDVDLLRARAGSLRFLAMLGADPTHARAQRAEARSILEALTQRLPKAPLLRAEFAAVLSDAAGMSRGALQPGDRDDLEQAAATALDLAREFPASSGVRDLAIEVLSKAARRIETVDAAAGIGYWREVVRVAGVDAQSDGGFVARSAQTRVALLAAQLGHDDEVAAALAELGPWVDTLRPEDIARRGADRGPRPPGPPPGASCGPRPGDRDLPRRDTEPFAALARLFEARGDEARAARLRALTQR